MTNALKYIFFSFFVIFSLSSFSQSFPEFDSPKQKAYGNIPTHDIARYFCVLDEGFLGSFLLSIFTVTMINQVL